MNGKREKLRRIELITKVLSLIDDINSYASDHPEMFKRIKSQKLTECFTRLSLERLKLKYDLEADTENTADQEHSQERQNEKIIVSDAYLYLNPCATTRNYDRCSDRTSVEKAIKNHSTENIESFLRDINTIIKLA